MEVFLPALWQTFWPSTRWSIVVSATAQLSALWSTTLNGFEVLLETGTLKVTLRPKTLSTDNQQANNWNHPCYLLCWRKIEPKLLVARLAFFWMLTLMCLFRWLQNVLLELQVFVKTTSCSLKVKPRSSKWFETYDFTRLLLSTFLSKCRHRHQLLMFISKGCGQKVSLKLIIQFFKLRSEKKKWIRLTPLHSILGVWHIDTKCL